MIFQNRVFLLNYFIIYLALLSYNVGVYTYIRVFDKHIDLGNENMLIINSIFSFVIAAVILIVYYWIFRLFNVKNKLKRFILFLGIIAVSMVDIFITTISDWRILKGWILEHICNDYGAYIPSGLIILFFIISAFWLKKNPE